MAGAPLVVVDPPSATQSSGSSRHAAGYGSTLASRGGSLCASRPTLCRAAAARFCSRSAQLHGTPAGPAARSGRQGPRLEGVRVLFSSVPTSGPVTELPGSGEPQKRPLFQLKMSNFPAESARCRSVTQRLSGISRLSYPVLVARLWRLARGRTDRSSAAYSLPRSG